MAAHHLAQAAPVLDTDKADYFPSEVVTISGKGFAPNTDYDVAVIRPDGSIVKGDGTFQAGWDTVHSDDAGAFVYQYQLDGIEGTYEAAAYASPWSGDLEEAPVATATFTDCGCVRPTATPTRTSTPVSTPTSTNTPKPSCTPVGPTPTKTRTPTRTPTKTRTPTFTRTPTRTSTYTPAPTSTFTPVPPTSTYTPTPIATDTATPTPSPTSTPTPTPTPTFTFTPMPTSTLTPTPTPTPTPTFTSTSQPTPTLTATPTSNPTPTPTGTNTSQPTATFTPVGGPTGTYTPTATATSGGNVTPTPSPTSATTVSPTPTGVRMEKDAQVNVPGTQNAGVLWIMKGGCVDPTLGKGCLAIDEWIYGIFDVDNSNDSDNVPEGLGAWEHRVYFDNRFVSLTPIPDSDWLTSRGRLVNVGVTGCFITIQNESSILEGCVTKDDPAVPGEQPGPNGPDSPNGRVERIVVVPNTDYLIYAASFRPTKDNGVVTTVADTDCEVTDTQAEQIPGTLPGQLTPVCTNAYVTIRMLEGDVNLDCKVDVADDQQMAFRYGATMGLLVYGRWWDLEPASSDGDIDIKDLQFVFGRNYSSCEHPIPDDQAIPAIPYCSPSPICARKPPVSVPLSEYARHCLHDRGGAECGGIRWGLRGGRLLVIEQRDERLDERRIELAAGVLPQLRDRLLVRHRLSVRPVQDHRGVGVDEGHNPP